VPFGKFNLCTPCCACSQSEIYACANSYIVGYQLTFRGITSSLGGCDYSALNKSFNMYPQDPIYTYLNSTYNHSPVSCSGFSPYNCGSFGVPQANQPTVSYSYAPCSTFTGDCSDYDTNVSGCITLQYLYFHLQKNVGWAGSNPSLIPFLLNFGIQTSDTINGGGIGGNLIFGINSVCDPITLTITNGMLASQANLLPPFYIYIIPKVLF